METAANKTIILLFSQRELFLKTEFYELHNNHRCTFRFNDQHILVLCFSGSDYYTRKLIYNWLQLAILATLR